jgi:hypothetical protein
MCAMFTGKSKLSVKSEVFGLHTAVIISGINMATQYRRTRSAVKTNQWTWKQLCALILQAEALVHFVRFPVSNCKELLKRHDPYVQASAFLESWVFPFVPDPETH